jgi:cytochrome c oxidase subunit 7c
MFSRAATRTTTSLVTRRAFHATRPRMSSPYHYSEGPYSNLPFNPHKRTFALKFVAFAATGFFAPFGIAGTWLPSALMCHHPSSLTIVPLVWQTYKPQ